MKLFLLHSVQIDDLITNQPLYFDKTIFFIFPHSNNKKKIKKTSTIHMSRIFLKIKIGSVLAKKLDSAREDATIKNVLKRMNSSRRKILLRAGPRRPFPLFVTTPSERVSRVRLASEALFSRLFWNFIKSFRARRFTTALRFSVRASACEIM